MKTNTEPPAMSKEAIAARLKYLGDQIEAERISYGELCELQSLSEHIDPSDVLLLEWAGVPEFQDDPDEPIVDDYYDLALGL